VGNHAIDEALGLGGKIISQRKVFLTDGIAVKCQVEFRLNLAGRTPCNLQKTNEFKMGACVKSFSNDVHIGN
jgi:hypothetical protein